MIIVITIVGVLLIILLIAIIILLTKNYKNSEVIEHENKTKKNSNSKDSSSKESQEYFEYDETTHIGANIPLFQNRAFSSEINKASIVLDEVPKIPEVQKTELINSMYKNDYAGLGETELLTGKLPDSHIAVISYEHDGRLYDYQMKSDFINIGRDPETCHLVIPHDKYIGKYHAQIFKKNNKFYIVDMNSKNGTYIEDERIYSTIEIKNNSIIRLASTKIIFTIL